MKKKLIAQLNAFDHDLERYVASVPDALHALRVKHLDPDALAEFATSYLPATKVEPADELRRLVNGLSISPTEIQDAIAAQLSPEQAKYFSELWKYVINEFDTTRPGLGSFLSHASGFIPTVLINPIRRVQGFVGQLVDRLQKKEGLPERMHGLARAKMQMSDVIEGDIPKDVTAIARQIATALRGLPGTIQETIGADPWPNAEEARKRLDLAKLKEDFEVLGRYVGRNWSPSNAHELRAHFLKAERVVHDHLVGLSYWEERRETPPAYKRQVSDLTRKICHNVAEVFEEWAVDIESTTTPLPGAGERKRDAKAAAIASFDAMAMSGEAPKAKEPGWKRLTVIRFNTGDGIARIDGADHRLTGTNDATFLEILKEKQGAPLLTKILISHCGGERPDRIYERLPAIIQGIIDKPGRGTGKKGYRML